MSKSYWMKDQKGNFSKKGEDTFDPEKRYVGIRLQQGVPLLDRDWNELEDIRRYEELMLRKWYVGNGTPDNGFKISAVGPPAGNDFIISAGRCIVDGFEAVNEKEIRYKDQDGVKKPLSVPTSDDRDDIVYLDVWIEEVTSKEDSDLKNLQDVKVPTCVRHKLEWRVRVDEGSKGHPEKEFHHHYDIAKIERKRNEYKIEKIEDDLLTTGLAVSLLKEATEKLTNNSIADALHRHSKLVGRNGSPDPALSVDNDGNVGIGAKLHVEGNFGIGKTGLIYWNKPGGNFSGPQLVISPSPSYTSKQDSDDPAELWLGVNTARGGVGRITLHGRVTRILNYVEGVGTLTALHVAGGNVGIGTTKLSEKLNVEEGAVAVNNADWSRKAVLGASGTGVYGSGSDQGVYAIGGPGGTNTYGLKALHGYGIGAIYSSGDVHMMDGQVGIGTPEPEGRLDVFTEGTAGAHLITNGHLFSLKGVNDPVKYRPRLPYIEWRKADNTRAMYLGWGETGDKGSTLKWVDMYLENNFNLSIRGGNVGIGTPKPEAKLDVGHGGNTILSKYLELRDYDDGTAGGAVRSIARDGNWMFWNGGVVVGQYSNGVGSIGTNNLVVKGKVGIGTPKPDHKLQIGDASTAVSMSLRGPDGNTKSGVLAFEDDAGTTQKWFKLIHDSKNNILKITSKEIDPIMTLKRTNGNVFIKGNLGTHDISPKPRNPRWGGGIHTWDVEAEGTMWSQSGYKTGKRDLAENYISDMDLEPGDVVCLDKDKDRIVLTDKPNDILVLGVISTEPGFLLDVEHDIEEEKVFPVALCGRVPCKVVDENGPVKRGDLLTSSSILGHGMKATPIKIDEQEFFCPGTIIGKALGSLESGKGVIDIFIFLM